MNRSILALVLGSIVVLVSIVVVAGQESPSPSLRGAIDIHVHGNPDSRPRALDGIDAARNARDRGMRAIVLKNHYEFTRASPNRPQAGSRHRGVRRSGSQPDGWRNQPRSGRVHGANLRQVGPHRMDAHVRCRERRPFREGGPALRQRVTQRRPAAGGERGHRADREARPHSGDGSFVGSRKA